MKIKKRLNDILFLIIFQMWGTGILYAKPSIESMPYLKCLAQEENFYLKKENQQWYYSRLNQELMSIITNNLNLDLGNQAQNEICQENIRYRSFKFLQLYFKNQMSIFVNADKFSKPFKNSLDESFKNLFVQTLQNAQIIESSIECFHFVFPEAPKYFESIQYVEEHKGLSTLLNQLTPIEPMLLKLKNAPELFKKCPTKNSKQKK